MSRPEITNHKAAIVGGGVIGGGWAARFLLMGWDVAVYDPDPEAERKIGEVMDNARRSLPALHEVALPPEGTLTFRDRIEDAVAGAAWIQESIPERLEMKQRAFDQIQAFCAADAVIGSSTSGFKPSELQSMADVPDQIIVAHPFNPVYLLPLVELVGSPDTTAKAADILTDLGMKPLIVRKEIDAHIADRFLEAVWREGLWMIKDGVATTEEIDDAIRFGFGLRWAQMGLFETYRVAGGEAGMAHFIAQFGPALKWPWTKLMDVPDLTDDLVKTIADQSDAQSGHHTIRELERIRDDNLVAMMRALKGRDWGAGALLNHTDRKLAPKEPDTTEPFVTVERTVPIDWADYNGHMNESRYGQVFSDAADTVMRMVGADAEYIASGKSFFTVEITTKFLEETHVGDPIRVTTQVLRGEGKKLELFHRMYHGKGQLLATGRQLLLHVDLTTRRTALPEGDVAEKMAALARAHAGLERPG
ncbi:MAG: carnitine 3-dehydrogenase [Alphaproteobacteria bacterium]|nr:carnitine 3-dehydrogenase [Alphaproteobacteria bacterium]